MIAGSPIVLAVALNGRTVLQLDDGGCQVCPVALVDRVRVAEALSQAAMMFLQNQPQPYDLTVATDVAMTIAECAEPADIAPSVGRLADAIADVAASARAHSPARLAS